MILFSQTNKNEIQLCDVKTWQNGRRSTTIDGDTHGILGFQTVDTADYRLYSGYPTGTG